MNDPITDSEAAKPALEVPLPAAFVEVMPYDVVHLQPQDHYDVHLRVTYDDGVPCDRTLRLAKSEGPDGRGITVSLFDDGDAMLVSVSQRWQLAPDSSVQYTLEEATAYDELAATMKVAGAAVTEDYDVNGAGISLNYVRGEASEDSAIAAFAEFYSSAPWTESRSLDNSAEGGMMLLLVNDTSFAQWATTSIVSVYERGPMAKPACDLECLCYGAAACGMVACPIGGFLNPACDVCAAAAGGCVVATVVSWIFDW